MTRLKDATFEGGSLTGVNGATSTIGSPILDSTNLVKGVYSVSVNAATQYTRFDFTASDDIYVSAYIYITDALANGRIIYINNGCRLDLRTNLVLRLANASGTQIGSDSPTLSLNTLYRVGIRWKKATGAGNDGQCEAWVTATGSPDAAFGSSFASGSNLTQAAQLSRVDVGNTATPINNFRFDNVRIDNTSMPTDDVAGGTNTPKSITLSVASTYTIQRNIAVDKLITSISNIGLQKTVQKVITIIENTSSVIQKNIVKPIIFVEAITTNVVKGVSKLLTVVSNVIINNSFGKATYKTISVIANANVSSMNTIGKMISAIQNTAITLSRSYFLSIVANVIQPVVISVNKGIDFTKYIQIGSTTLFSKVVNTLLGNTYFVKNVRALTLGFASRALVFINKQSRSIIFKDTNDDN